MIVIDVILLVLFLRSLAAPLYLVAASVLALAAALGATTYFFRLLSGPEGLTYYVPFAASVLLISLGSDYTIFVVGRIWEERKVRPLRGAIETAVPRARSAVSVAAVTLALSFSMLAIVDLWSFRQLAFLLAAGVLIDAFFVRSLLVPALVALFGRTWTGEAAERRAEAAAGEAPRRTPPTPASRTRPSRRIDAARSRPEGVITVPKHEKKRKRAPARDDMPSTIARSDEKAQRTWKETHDSAVEQYGEGERAHRTAFASLKHTYEKEGDRWVPKDEKGASDPRSEMSTEDARAGKGETYGGIDYYGHTKKEFEQRAKRLGITGYSRMRKAELVKRIEQRERSESARERRGRKAA